MDPDKPRTRLRTENSKQLPKEIDCSKMSKIFPLRFCMSCPTVNTSTKPIVTPEKLSHLKTRHVSLQSTKLNTKHTSVITFLKNYSSNTNLLTPCVPQVMGWRSYSKSCSCPSCCGCLPSPCCNEPPRCIQCMTGYYFYPYGYWFCGPYHVGGTCCPVGPSGICGPCPSPKCCPSTTACVCPAAAAVVTQTAKGCAKTKPISEQSFESPISDQKPQRFKKKPIKPESGVRKASRPAKSCKPSLSGELEKATTRHPMGKITKVLKTTQSLKTWCLPRRCFSCTSIMMPTKTQTLLTSKHSWYNNYISWSPNKKFHSFCNTKNLPIRNRLSSASLSLPTSTSVGDKVHYSDFVKDSWTVCGCPPCDCECDLPPPCNEPPKCLQCMTGYYHYPYGFWFCGPYNVCTGPVPCEGPVKVGGPCGPVAGPCPEFGSCASCQSCSPCGPCASCGLCALCDPYSSYAQCGHYGLNAAYGQCASCTQRGHSAVHASYSSTPYEYSYPTYDSSNGTQAYQKSELKTEISPKKTDCFMSTTLPSKAQKESLSSIKSMPTSFMKKYPFNKPTYKIHKPKGSESRSSSSNGSPLKNETYE